jgi:hypothetical protein
MVKELKYFWEATHVGRSHLPVSTHFKLQPDSLVRAKDLVINVASMENSRAEWESGKVCDPLCSAEREQAENRKCKIQCSPTPCVLLHLYAGLFWG